MRRCAVPTFMYSIVGFVLFILVLAAPFFSGRDYRVMLGLLGIVVLTVVIGGVFASLSQALSSSEAAFLSALLAIAAVGEWFGPAIRDHWLIGSLLLGLAIMMGIARGMLRTAERDRDPE